MKIFDNRKVEYNSEGHYFEKWSAPHLDRT
jgi:hypothetical protein